MSYDGITMAAVRSELNRILISARVDKIHQHHPLEILLRFRTKEGVRLLLCSAEARFARVHLTASREENPLNPPAFCMLLRKLLTGAKFLRAEQTALERVLTFVFRTESGWGTDTETRLICEMMGKHSNIILTERTESGETILGSIKTVTGEMSRHRAVMPGEPYIPPPRQNKLDLSAVEEEPLAMALAEHGGLPPDKMLSAAVEGVSPALAAEMIAQASAGDESHPLEMVRSLTVELRELGKAVREGAFSPCLARNSHGEITAFFPVRPERVTDQELCGLPSVNEALDTFYRSQLSRQLLRETKQQLFQAVRSALSRAEKKKCLQQEELREMEGADRYRVWGELLTAGAHLLHSGMKEAMVTDYYSPSQEEIRIPLNPAISPQENIRRYFKKYRKLKDGTAVLAARLRETAAEIEWLESLHNAVEYGDLDSLAEVRDEMEQAGLLRKGKSPVRRETPVPAPLRYISADGIEILVGKNNRQNDRLTLKTAAPDDTWLHTKDIPGAHVLIRSSDPPETTLVEAAKLAARYSKAARSANVPVDYTLARYVKKPRGAKPGMVIYERHKTIFVTPDS